MPPVAFRRAAVVCLLLIQNAAAPASAAARPPLRDAIKAELQQYLAERGTIEHISAASVSISRAPGKAVDVAAGTTTYGGKTPATAANLFQIGSNTKAFTATMVLQLQQQGRVSIHDTAGKWLPQYAAWKSIQIRDLLNMTSGIPTYDAVPSMLASYAAHPYEFLSTEHLIGVVYPQSRFKPGDGWMYSNTAYLMSQMIVERITRSDYAVQFHRRFIDAGPHLSDTYYRAGLYPASITNRMVAGYFYSHDADNRPLAPLLGRDVRPFNLSWTQGAGGIVATPHAVVDWVRALYESPMLTDAGRKDLETLVSMKTGKPIGKASADSRGFGLGVGEMTMPKLGTFWFYEGETLGYRMLYAYFPTTKMIIALGLNSQPDAKEDKIGQLLSRVYGTVLEYQ